MKKKIVKKMEILGLGMNRLAKFGIKKIKKMEKILKYF